MGEGKEGGRRKKEEEKEKEGKEEEGAVSSAPSSARLRPPGSELLMELGCGTNPSGTEGTKSLATVSPSSFICGQRTRWHTK